jgi:antitoxin MazE
LIPDRDDKFPLLIYNEDVYYRSSMQVSKWGNSLAVRLPSAVVEALGLKEGDHIEIRVKGDREFEIARDRSRSRALSRLQKLQRPLPRGFVFDREEANAR